MGKVEDSIKSAGKSGGYTNKDMLYYTPDNFRVPVEGAEGDGDLLELVNERTKGGYMCDRGERYVDTDLPYRKWCRGDNESEENEVAGTSDENKKG